jgi:cyclin B
MNAARTTDHVVEKKMLAGKAAPAGAGHQRAALGNISNRTAVGGHIKDAVKGKKASQAVKPTAAKNARNTEQPQIIDTRQLPVVKVEAPMAEMVEVKEEQQVAAASEEAPMDLSVTGGGGTAEEEAAFSKQLWKLSVQDIDADDGDNPQLVSEYVNDIYAYMRELELAFPVAPRCLGDQTEINGRMRSILIDWLVQVHQRFHLLQETLFLTVAILDRFLQVENVAKNKLQLVGVTSMWIASKYEEMYAPEVADFVYITDNAYSKADIRQMECQILRVLDFQLGRPLAIHFLRRNSKAGEVDATTHTMAKYLMELTIVDYEMVHCRPSMIAAAALCLAIKLLSPSPSAAASAWTVTLTHYSTYTESQLQPMMSKMAHLIVHAGTGKLIAIKSKYQSSKFMRISKFDELNGNLVHELDALSLTC